MIPKIIHRIWVGGPMPDHYRQYGEAWEKLHPGWSFRLWTDEDFQNGWLQNQDLFDKAEQYVPKDAVGQFRSDVARYEILYRFGGVYVDCDVEPLKPFDGLLEAEAFAGWEKTSLYVGNTVIGSVPGAAFWGQMIGAVLDASKENKGKAATWLSGPRVVTRLYNSINSSTKTLLTRNFTIKIHISTLFNEFINLIKPIN
jgi:mannosyltransferase OCH1-like enzyme